MDNSVWSIYLTEQSGEEQLWIGTNNGLNKIDRTSGSYVHYKNNPSDYSSILPYSVNSIFKDSYGNFWVSTLGYGINKLTLEGKFIRYKYDASNPASLFSNNVYKMYEDSGRNIWICTNDGLTNIEYNLGAAFVSEKGELFFGGYNGVDAFFPSNLINEIPPKILLTSVNVPRKELNFNPSFSEIKLIELAHDENSISFELTAIHYANPSKNIYAYMMEGIDEDWILSNTKRNVEYSRLPIGKYTFKGKAANSDGVWNEEASTFTLIIIPPYWETWWFISIVITSIFGFAYLFYRRRLANIEKLEKIRIEIADELHDEIGSNLGLIAMLAQSVQTNLLQFNQASKHLETIYCTALKSADSMRDIIWFIKPANDNAEKILLRMKDFVSKILVNINHEFKIINDPFTDELGLKIKRNIYLIIKESLNNIVKHSQADYARIIMERKDGTFELIIEDNGTGFDKEQENFGNGLNNILRRANQAGGKLDIVSSKNKGTRLVFKLRI
jgi:signal transduction histidine kinase